MLTIRRPRLFFIGLSVLILLSAANYVEYRVRLHRQSDVSDVGDVVVQTEQGPLHTSISIVENSFHASGGQVALTFATLGQWQFDPKAPPPCPQTIQALNGREVSCLGFMYPLQQTSVLKVFLLTRSTRTCCYGPKPQYNQYLLVEMPKPVKFERLAPVTVTGKFFVDPHPEDGYIYRLEGTSVKVIPDDVPDIDAKEAAEARHLPLFDFAPLISMQDQPEGSRSVPADLSALAGKRVILDGWVQDRTQDRPPRLIVERLPDLSSSGLPMPTLFNAILVVPRDARQVPPTWKQHVVFTGVLRITEDPAKWSDNGIVRLEDTVIGVPGFGTSSGEIRPRVYWVWEAAAAGLLVLLTIRLRHSDHLEIVHG